VSYPDFPLGLGAGNSPPAGGFYLIET